MCTVNTTKQHTEGTRKTLVCACVYTDLVGECLRGGEADSTAVRDAHQFSAELQDVGQRQVANVGVRFTAGTEQTA